MFLILFLIPLFSANYLNLSVRNSQYNFSAQIKNYLVLTCFLLDFELNCVPKI